MLSKPSTNWAIAPDMSVFPCHTFESPFEFAVHFLSEMARAPWGCLYRNCRVETRWDRISLRPFISQGGRSREEIAGSVSFTEAGWLFSFLVFPRLLCAPLTNVQVGPCGCRPHPPLDFCLPLLFAGWPSSPLRFHVGWRQQSHAPSAGGTHCGQWSEEERKRGRGTGQSLLQCVSRLSLPTPSATVPYSFYPSS